MTEPRASESPQLRRPSLWLHHLASCRQCRGYARGDCDERCETGQALYDEHQADAQEHKPHIPETPAEWLSGR